MAKRKDLIWLKRISIFLASGLIVYFFVMTIILPVSGFKMDPRQNNKALDRLLVPDLEWKLKVSDSIKSKAADLVSTESYLLSKLEMAENDSISLTVSLRDSSISLVVKGVTIYSAKIYSYSISQILKDSDPFILSQWLSKPFTIESYYSSIPKIPVLYKKAPKDTIEANSQLEPDPLAESLDPVFYTFQFEPRLSLTVSQIEAPDKSKLKGLKSYRRSLKLIARKKVLHSLVKGEPLEFVPGINISTDQKAARVIFRALPEGADMALQLPL
ncbi:MAG: hypothetical protein H6538_07525 [Bacteroidales bacterium]|nr:hypothetical protein [Bacteroidales bacterium]